MAEMAELKVVDKDEKKPAVMLGKLAMYEISGVVSKMGSIDLKSSSSLLIAKFSRKIREELKDRDEQRKKLAKKYGEKVAGSDDPDAFQIIPTSAGGDFAKWNNFRKESVDLDDTAVNFGDTKFKLRDFRTADKEADVPPIVFEMLIDLKVFEE